MTKNTKKLVFFWQFFWSKTALFSPISRLKTTIFYDFYDFWWFQMILAVLKRKLIYIYTIYIYTIYTIYIYIYYIYILYIYILYNTIIYYITIILPFFDNFTPGLRSKPWRSLWEKEAGGKKGEIIQFRFNLIPGHFFLDEGPTKPNFHHFLMKNHVKNRFVFFNK